MTVHNWQDVKVLLHQAIALEPHQRAGFLDEVCAANETLRSELESLLTANDELSAEFLQCPLPNEFARELAGSNPLGALVAGQVFAQRYQLIRRLGEGGMGQVWLAEQLSPLQRQVALKLIKAGMYDEAVAQRFQFEGQSLAIMDHPAIAKVFDAGATPQGQPYLVMEYVPGLPITDYCDQNKLNIRERLELFIQACEGVQHAHQKAIIHRDLKPSNIVVIQVDGKAVPRIIDFGLAKATPTQGAAENLLTQLGQFLGTPGYMSPEQVDLGIHDIDTRTDVYSLGVVLFVLLTGRQPFETRRRQKPSLEEWLRQLREEEPPAPSAKLSSDKNSPSTAAAAAARGTEPKQLLRLVRGDLDWIALKALERDRARRYATPSALAGDLCRYLNHEPVEARPTIPGYRLRKYAWRHRVAAAAGIGLLVLLAVFSVLQTLQLRHTMRERDHANLERDRANHERERANRIADFMTDMFKVSDPSEARGNRVTAREILDKASSDIGKGLARDPDVQSQMMFVMARSYENLELYARAQELSRGALDARLGLHGPDDRNTLESMRQLGVILQGEGHLSDAENWERRALAGARRTLGPEDALTLGIMDDLASIRGALGHPGDEDHLERQIIAVSTRTLGPETGQTLRSMDNLASALQDEGHYAEAEQLYRSLLEIHRRISGRDRPETLGAQGNLAMLIGWEGHFAEAEKINRDLLATSRRVLGPDHPNILGIMLNLSENLRAEGRLSEAEKLVREAEALIEERRLGSEHSMAYMVQFALANLLLAEEKFHEAERSIRDGLATAIRIGGAESPRTLSAQHLLALILMKERRYIEAGQTAQVALDAEIRTLGPQDSLTLATQELLGLALAHAHRYGEASKLFRDAIDKEASGDQAHSGSATGAQWRLWTAWYQYALAAMAAGHPREAVQYLHEAIGNGYDDADRLMADDDFKALHASPEFRQLVARLKHPS